MDKRLLIVDDAAFMRRMIRVIVEQSHIASVVEAVSGEDALQQFRACKPDLVLMDIAMSGMNGIEALQQIMQQDPSARVIIMSGLSSRGLVIEAFRFGAVDFIAKPFQTDHMLDTICKHLEPAIH